MFLDHPGIEKAFLRDSGCLNDASHMFRGNLFLKTFGGLGRTCFTPCKHSRSTQEPSRPLRGTKKHDLEKQSKNFRRVGEDLL